MNLREKSRSLGISDLCRQFSSSIQRKRAEITSAVELVRKSNKNIVLRDASAEILRGSFILPKMAKHLC